MSCQKICSEDKASRMRGRSYMSDDTEEDEEAMAGKGGFGIRLQHLTQHNASHNTYAGGVQAQVIEGPGIYYMGIIDALQKYTWKKKLETLIKTYVQRLVRGPHQVLRNGARGAAVRGDARGEECESDYVCH